MESFDKKFNLKKFPGFFKLLIVCEIHADFYLLILS